MKLATLAAAGLLAMTSAAMADPILGTWQSPEGENGGFVHVKVSKCGADICGTIVEVFNNDNKSSKGKRMIWGMKPAGGGAYKGGKVWAPDQDKVYRGKLQLNGNSLKVSGCVLGGAVCRGGTFRRVN